MNRSAIWCLALVVAAAGCDGGSRSSDGAVVLEQGQPDQGPDTGGRERGGQQDGVAPAGWTVASNNFELDTSYEYLVAGHPSRPKTLAVANMPDSSRAVTVVTTGDLGQTVSRTTLHKVDTTGGYNFGYLGFGYDPGDGSRLTALTRYRPGGGSFSTTFVVSSDSGKSFAKQALAAKHTPEPPDRMKWVPGSKSALAVRVKHMLHLSGDLGQSFATSYSYASQCPYSGEFAVSPADHGVALLTCGDKAVLRCDKGACVQSSMPNCTKTSDMEYCLHDAARAVAAPCSRLVYSEDGGKSFKEALYDKDLIGSVKFLWDPRSGKKKVVYALIQLRWRLYCSANGGAKWTDITPKVPVPGGSGVPKIRDYTVMSDGTVIALARPGLLRYPAY